jgi:hypothetical protein
MSKATIRLKNTITLVVLLTITGCSSPSHHHNKRLQFLKPVVLKPVAVTQIIAKPTIRKSIGVKRRFVIINR